MAEQFLGGRERGVVARRAGRIQPHHLLAVSWVLGVPERRQRRLGMHRVSARVVRLRAHRLGEHLHFLYPLLSLRERLAQSRLRCFAHLRTMRYATLKPRCSVVPHMLAFLRKKLHEMRFGFGSGFEN